MKMNKVHCRSEKNIRAVLAKAKSVIKVTAKEKSRATALAKFGMKSLDALHIALAESGNADFFVPVTTNYCEIQSESKI
jgi:hypothetical protein